MAHGVLVGFDSVAHGVLVRFDSVAHGVLDSVAHHDPDCGLW